MDGQAMRRRIRRGMRRRAELWLTRIGLLDAPEAPVARAAVASPVTVAPSVDVELLRTLIDDMIRPGLQGDGGDIELVDVTRGDITVRLVGSCRSCPSSTLTLRMGIERLLQEELPGFERLIALD